MASIEDQIAELAKDIPPEAWKEFDREHSPLCVGDKVVDEDGHVGRVCIYWDDGDICTLENDAAHPNPKRLMDNVD